MKRLQFDYYMKLEYSEPVKASHFTLKCFPRNDARQKLLTCRTELIPQVAFSSGNDSFGNDLIYGAVEKTHAQFSVRVTGEVELLQTQYESIAEENEVYLYRNGHGMNLAGEKIRAYHASLSASLPSDELEKAFFLMQQLHSDFQYEKGCTDANTAAETAFSLGRGVCQDYSHIFIALCHLSGIPARYVTGLLIGEGESHAWVEILYQGKWLGLDVTNNISVTDSHLKFGHGRDAADCRINRGIVYGETMQTQSVSAVTTLLEQ